MFSYVQPTLDKAKSHGIIIHVGTNDVSAKRKRPSDIADSIMIVGKKCHYTGVRNIIVSSLVCRKSPSVQTKVNEVNDVLRDLYIIDGLVFIDIQTSVIVIYVKISYI